MTWSNEEGEFPHNKEDIKNKITESLNKLYEETGTFPIPLTAPKRGNICQSFWGRYWCRHLDDFSHWLQRLPRGRSLLRKGNVYTPTIKEGGIHGWVASNELYEVLISVTPLSKEAIKLLIDEINENSLSLLDLWEGNLSDSLLETLTCSKKENSQGLFPRPEDIRASCSCPDWADVCEHSAALLYAAGILFEQSPMLLFLLRGIEPATLHALPHLSKNSSVIQNDRLEDIFGIDINLD